MCSLFTALCTHPVLTLPDFTKPFQIENDASNTAVGGVLMQKHSSFQKPIAILGKIFTNSEKHYSVYDSELLIIITCYRAWCPYIDSQLIVVITDHKPFIHLYT